MSLLGIICAQANEVDYCPVLSEGKSWEVVAVNDGNISGHYMFSVAGDTIVAGMACKKISIVSKDNSAVTSQVLAHEKNGKVCQVKSDGTTTLLFDMSLGVGDDMLSGIVTQVDEIVVNGAHRKRQVIDSGVDMVDCYFYAVEGIGLNTTRFVWNHDPGIGELGDNFFMLYCYQDGEKIFSASDFTAAQVGDYHPLVREGVRWHTAYIENPGMMESNYHYVDNKIEFRGDTILSGVTYKKCYMYETTSWTPDARLICYAREASGKVMIVYDEDHCDWFAVDETYTIPGVYCYLTGERVFYDFSDMEGFVECWDTSDKIVSVDSIPFNTNEVTRYVMADGYNHVYYIVEGVGCDKPDHSVCPIMPFADPPTGNVSRWGGLIMLTNLDDEPLYKGSLYEKYRMQEYTDLNGDGKVDISDINEAINVMLGKSAAAADVNGDGACDIADVNAVINAMLGKQ